MAVNSEDAPFFNFISNFQATRVIVNNIQILFKYYSNIIQILFK